MTVYDCNEKGKKAKTANGKKGTVASSPESFPFLSSSSAEDPCCQEVPLALLHNLLIVCVVICSCFRVSGVIATGFVCFWDLSLCILLSLKWVVNLLFVHF